MPCISKDRRELIDPALSVLVKKLKAINPTGGDLNYTITRLVMGVFQPKSYTEYERIFGMVFCMALELYRRALAPYEDTKINDPNNGDVPEYM